MILRMEWINVVDPPALTLGSGGIHSRSLFILPSQPSSFFALEHPLRKLNLMPCRKCYYEQDEPQRLVPGVDIGKCDAMPRFSDARVHDVARTVAVTVFFDLITGSVYTVLSLCGHAY